MKMGGGYSETNQGDANRLSLFFGLDLKTKQEAFELLGQGKYQEVCEYLNKNVLGKTQNYYVSRVLLPKQDNNLKANLEKKVNSTLREEIIEKEKGNIESFLNSAEKEYKDALESRLRKVVGEFCYLSAVLDKVGELEKKLEERKQKSRLKRTAEILNENYQCLGREDLTIEGQLKELNKRIDKAKDLHNSVTDLYYKDVNYKLDDLIGKYEAMEPIVSLDTQHGSRGKEVVYEISFKNNSIYPWLNPSLTIKGDCEYFDKASTKKRTESFGFIPEKDNRGHEIVSPISVSKNAVLCYWCTEVSDYDLQYTVSIPKTGPSKFTKLTVKGTCEHSFIKKDYSAEEKLI